MSKARYISHTTPAIVYDGIPCACHLCKPLPQSALKPKQEQIGIVFERTQEVKKKKV